MKNIIGDYHKKNCGKLMTNNVPIVYAEETIGSVENRLLKKIKQLKSIDYIYVLNKKRILEGVISIKELFRQPKNKIVSSVMAKNVIKVRPNTHQERAAYLSLKNNIKSIPVVDANGKFLGAVLNDDILKTTYDELQEDISHFVGVKHHLVDMDNVNSMSIISSLEHRLPWLIIGIMGGIVAANVIGMFENTLSENIILAAFIPLIVYIASAVSTQAAFFFVRDLAIDRKINFAPYIFRQFKIIFSMGAAISILIFGFSLLFYRQFPITVVLSLAVFITILSSVITGIFIPYAFSKLHFDPANASGPIATIIQDLVSVTIYLLIANIML